MSVASYGISAKIGGKINYVPIKDIEMTELAQLLGRLIRERGGYLPSHDNWLGEKANEIRKTINAETSAK